MTCDAGKSLLTKSPRHPPCKQRSKPRFRIWRDISAQSQTIGTAYEDARDHKAGGATFSANLNGQPVKGIVSCKLNDKGADGGSRLLPGRCQQSRLGQTDAGKCAGQFWLRRGSAASLGSDAQVYQFPDGTGSITLAKGWQTQASSAITPIRITGPNDEHIGINITLQRPELRFAADQDDGAQRSDDAANGRSADRSTADACR